MMNGISESPKLPMRHRRAQSLFLNEVSVQSCSGQPSRIFETTAASQRDSGLQTSASSGCSL